VKEGGHGRPPFLAKIRRGEVPALGLIRRSDGNRFWQFLRQCRFFSLVSPAVLPASIAGEGWEGIRIDDCAGGPLALAPHLARGWVGSLPRYLFGRGSLA
jgi:hypothetical protein